MPSTYTTNLGLEKPATGEKSGTWGDSVNVTSDLIDQAIDGIISITLGATGSTGSPNALPVTNGSVSNGRNKFIEFVDGGDLGGTAYVQLTPNDAEKIVFIRNSLTASRSIIVFQGTYSASNDFEITNGSDVLLKFNGAGGSATVTDVFANLDVTALTTGSVNKVTVTAPASSATLTIANGKTLTANNSLTLAGTDGKTLTTNASLTLAGTDGKTLTTSNSLTLAGTDSTTMTFPSSSATVAGLGIAQTFTAKQTFAGSTSVLAASFKNVVEPATISATAATGTINYDVTTQSVLYYTSNAAANWTVNFRASSGTTLNAAMATGDAMTLTFLVTQGSSAYYNNVVKVDGSSVTPKYQGGSAPTSGNASGIDIYTYTVIKTGDAAFTVLASQTQFA